MLLSESSADREPGEARGQRALRDFAYRGFARWFPPCCTSGCWGPSGGGLPAGGLSQYESEGALTRPSVCWTGYHLGSYCSLLCAG